MCLSDVFARCVCVQTSRVYPGVCSIDLSPPPPGAVLSPVTAPRLSESKSLLSNGPPLEGWLNNDTGAGFASKSHLPDDRALTTCPDDRQL